MSDEQFHELVEDIRRHGQMVPIWKSGDEIIDGRKRLKACRELGIEPKFMDLSPDQDAESLSYSLNILRTHYTPSQRAMFAAKRVTATRADGGAIRESRKTPSLNLEKVAPVTVRQASREAGVSAALISQASALHRAAGPEVVAAVEAGRITLHSAQQIVEAVPKDEQSATVDKVIAANTGKARQTPTAKVLGTTPGFKRSPKKPLLWRIERGLDQLDNAIDVLTDAITEGTRVGHAGVPAWIRHLAESRSRMTKIINGHKGAEA